MTQIVTYSEQWKYKYLLFFSHLRVTEEKQGPIQKSDVNFSKVRLISPRKRNIFYL
jgi:hypothetical protein